VLEAEDVPQRGARRRRIRRVDENVSADECHVDYRRASVCSRRSSLARISS
jgi:hypothetical protein